MIAEKFKQLHEPQWSSTEALPSDLNPVLRNWLVDSGSLTARLRGGDGKFVVKLQSQGWGEVRPSEIAFLKLDKKTKAQIRVVKEFRDDQVIIYARTVLPESTLSGLGTTFTTLGDRPIGEVLFADPDLQRGLFQFACVHQQHFDFHAATEHLAVKPDFLWARRSIFTCFGKPLLVSEYFLPSILN